MKNFDIIKWLGEQLNPYAKPGGLLLFLNVGGMILAALSNSFAILIDKNTSKEEKKTLIPAGLVTGAANIGVYYLMTDKMIKKAESQIEDHLKNLNPDELAQKALEFANAKIAKAQKGGFLGLGKKSEEYINSIKTTLLKDGEVTDKAKELFKSQTKAGASVLGAFAGAVVGCSIVTPIIRDVSAYFVQKRMEKNNPNMQEKPYRPYFDPSHTKVGYNGQKQPLSMKNYMAFTNGNMKI